MAPYVVLLRGINVGKGNRMKMDDLKVTAGKVGAGHVRTYIQSGNIVLESALSADGLKAALERAIAEDFGVKLEVFVRTAEQWDRLIAGCPFAHGELKEGESIHLLLTADPVTELQREQLANASTGRDRYVAGEREIYFFFAQSMLDSPLAVGLTKSAKGSTLTKGTTMRNWNTVVKLQAMLRATGN